MALEILRIKTESDAMIAQSSISPVTDIVSWHHRFIGCCNNSQDLLDGSLQVTLSSEEPIECVVLEQTLCAAGISPLLDLRLYQTSPGFHARSFLSCGGSSAGCWSPFGVSQFAPIETPHGPCVLNPFPKEPCSVGAVFGQLAILRAVSTEFKQGSGSQYQLSAAVKVDLLATIEFLDTFLSAVLRYYGK